MNSIQATAVPSYIIAAGAPAGPAAEPPMLPPPSDGVQSNDALTMLLVMLSKKNQEDAKSGVQNIGTAKLEREQKLAAAKAAYEKMKESQNDPFKWVGDLFKAVVAVASAIATVATGGAASPALTASAMAFGSVVQQTQAFGDLSNVIGAGANLLGGLGTGNLALIASQGTTFTGAVGAATKDFDGKTSLAFSVTGQFLSMFAGFSPPAGQNDPAMMELGRDGKVFGIAGQTTYQIDRVVRDGDAAGAAIDMKQARNAMARLDRLIGTLIDGVKEAHNSQNKAVRVVEGAIQTNNQTALVAAGVRG